MNLYKADLHIHTVLSPCGSLDMSPRMIVQKALENGLDIIGITDHNSTRQCSNVSAVAAHTDLKVFLGVEITTREEIHCLAYFENFEALNIFQIYLDQYLPEFKNNPEKFGYQVVVDADENIMYEESTLLITGLNQSIDEIASMVYELNGIFIPAHINKPKYSLMSQLGFIPRDLKVDAYEISRHVSKEAICQQVSFLKDKSIIQNSDAHFPEEIGGVYNLLQMQTPTFNEFKMALHQLNGRAILG